MKWTIYILSVLMYLQFVGFIAVFHTANNIDLVDIEKIETCDLPHETPSCCSLKVIETASCCTAEVESSTEDLHDCDEGNCSDDDCDCKCCPHASPIFLAFFFDDKESLEGIQNSKGISLFFEDYAARYNKTYFQPPRLV